MSTQRHLCKLNLEPLQLLRIRCDIRTCIYALLPIHWAELVWRLMYFLMNFCIIYLCIYYFILGIIKLISFHFQKLWKFGDFSCACVESWRSGDSWLLIRMDFFMLKILLHINKRPSTKHIHNGSQLNDRCFWFSGVPTFFPSTLSSPTSRLTSASTFLTPKQYSIHCFFVVHVILNFQMRQLSVTNLVIFM